RREAGRTIYVASINNESQASRKRQRPEFLGQIRFEQSGVSAVVSVSLAPEARGRNWGPALIVQGVQRYFAETDAARIEAYIKPENQPSLRAFQTADFRDAGDTVVRNQPARRFELPRASCILPPAS